MQVLEILPRQRSASQGRQWFSYSVQLEKIIDMKKAILRILLLICGLNVFTSCYGMPPGDWPEPTPLPEEQEQTKVDDADSFAIPPESALNTNITFNPPITK